MKHRTNTGVRLLAGALALSGCATFARGGPERDLDAERAVVRLAADSMADAMAAAISRRDAQALAWLFIAHPYAAFVSDGLRIPQSRIADVIGGSYDALQSLDFRWERRQTQVLAPDAAAMTAWAVYTAVDSAGRATCERAVYSHLIVNDRGRWRFLTSHKSLVERLPVTTGVR